jgi:dihydrofolate reductase
VISTLFVSADGVAEIDPDWHFPYFDENMGRAVTEDYATSDVLLIGRETYDSFAGAWPDREVGGEQDAPFAKQLGDMRKVVASRQQLNFTWRNSELIESDLADTVVALKTDPQVRGILIPGSLSVVQQLLAAGLIDELRLLVHPVAARKGRRLFDDGEAAYHLKVTATEVMFPDRASIAGGNVLSLRPTDASSWCCRGSWRRSRHGTLLTSAARSRC